MSPNEGKNIINLNAVRAHKKENREIDFIPQVSRSSRNSEYTHDKSTTQRRRSTNSREKRNVRNSYNHTNKKYNSSLKKNYVKIKRSIVTGTLAATLALGGLVGYQVGSHTTGNIEYSLDEYNPTDLFNGTNNLIKTVADDTLIKDMPEVKENLTGYYLDTYKEYTVSPLDGDVKLKLNYTSRDPKDSAKSVIVSLPKDFAKKVYLPYKDLRETSHETTNKEKEKASYWLKINKNVTDLTNGLETYIETTKDKQYVDSAKTVLDNAKLIDDDEGR